MDALDHVVASFPFDDPAAAREWFRSLHKAASSDEVADLDSLRQALESDNQPAEAVERLVRDLDRLDSREAIEQIARIREDELLNRFEQRAPAEPAGGGGAPAVQASDPAAEDPDAWNAYLAQNGPFWDGTEEGWSTFRPWFAHYAAEAGVGATAEGFLVGAETSGDRPGFFARYGVAVPTAGGSGEPAAEDPDTWNAYLAQNGPFWDGTEEGWSTFRPWFAHYGAEAGVGATAESFLAGAEASGDMTGFFARYGIALPSASGEVEPDGVPAAEAAAPVVESLLPADADPLLKISIDGLVPLMTEEEMKAISEADPDELQRLLAEVQAEAVAEARATA